MRKSSLFVLALVGCSNLTGPRGPSGPGPDLTVLQAVDVGTVQQGAQVSGRDGGASTLFQGHSVWLYSDTFVGHPNYQGYTLISDSWAWTDNLTVGNGITGFQQVTDATGDPAMFLPLTAAEVAYNAEHNGDHCQVPTCNARWALWLASIAVDSARNRALVFYNYIYDDPNGFNRIGTSAATWGGIGQTPVRPTINASAAHPDLLFGENEPDFGGAVLMVNGTLYAYSCGASQNGKPCLLARVGPANVWNRSAWTYYAGNGNWSSNISSAVVVFEGLDILSVSWNAYLQRYIAIYAYPLSNNVMARTATAPEGPWSGEKKIFTARAPVDGSDTYDAQAHQEYDVAGGQTMYVSYSRGTGDFTSEIRLEAVTLGRVANQ
jgi:hypothetical protein